MLKPLVRKRLALKHYDILAVLQKQLFTIATTKKIIPNTICSDIVTINLLILS